jgi:hypothetical protein
MSRFEASLTCIERGNGVFNVSLSNTQHKRRGHVSQPSVRCYDYLCTPYFVDWHHLAVDLPTISPHQVPPPIIQNETGADMRTLVRSWDTSPKHFGTDLLLQDSPPITRYPLRCLARMHEEVAS